jgi:hypothetical protein
MGKYGLKAAPEYVMNKMSEVIPGFKDLLQWGAKKFNDKDNWVPSMGIAQMTPDIAKKYMRTILEPSLEVKFEVNQILNDLELISKEFSVIHIRSGDKYLKQSTCKFNPDYINKLLFAINERIDSNKKYLLISDNNQIKNIILTRFPDMKAVVKEITHFGEGQVLEEEKVKNTLIDFYLLSLTREIFSFSAYKHGSGFSYWCAQTYDIPYICKYIS